MPTRKYILYLILFVSLFVGCVRKAPSYTTLSQYIPTDTLRVVTQYGATSFFLDQNGDTLGYEYELAKQFAKHLGLPLKVIPVSNDSLMLSALQQHTADISCYQVTVTQKLLKTYRFVSNASPSHLVLVQLIGHSSITDISDLSQKEVWVKKGTPHHRRLIALNKEIGGDIRIQIASDSLNTDDLMEKVIDGEIPYTFAYRDKALLQKQFSRQVDVRIPVSLPQRTGWLVRASNKKLYDLLLQWMLHFKQTEQYAVIQHLYWDKNPYFLKRHIRIPQGNISPFDSIFKKYAERIDWDWRLLAAVAYAESGFENHLISWAGARGIMQLMPRTAIEFGVSIEEIDIPSQNIKAGVEYIKSLDMVYKKIEDREERIKFILASYNAGPAHIIDAMSLAEKYGKNKHIWFDNVAYYLDKLDEPTYYNDPVVKYGKFKAYETLRYVPYVLDTYMNYLNIK